MIKNYREYLNESAGVELTKRQKNWLDKCAKGRWQLNPQTGLIDVQDDFYCSEQGLDSFKGVRFGHVSGDFYCDWNKLTSLVGAPQSVDGDFDCESNNLTSLEGAPQSVVGDFHCYRNKLISLKGFPMEIKGVVDLDPNPIWKKIKPMVSGMSRDEKKFFYKFAAVDQTGTAESLERIARSIERMRMI